MNRFFYCVLFLYPLLSCAANTYVHVFVHGTTMPGFLLLKQSAQKPFTYQEKYISFVEKSRNDERFYDDSIMLECGLAQVGKPLIDRCKACTLDEWQGRRAAVQAITAYDDFMDHAQAHLYYVYGWNGLLSDEFRKQEAKKLYQELVNVKKKLVEQDKKEPTFIIHAHSHGGNIVLYLALQEEIDKQGLSIEHLMLYEMPVQVETARYCLSPIFKQVSLLYSNGDFIQTADCFSTSGGKSYKTFSELISLEGAQNRVQEVLVKMNGDDKVLQHRSYFFFDAYYGLSNARKSLFGSNEAIAFINPLPLVVCSPVFMTILEEIFPKIKVMRCDIDICVGRERFLIYVGSDYYGRRCSANIWPIIQRAKNRVATTWSPYAKTSDLKKLLWLGEHFVLR